MKFSTLTRVYQYLEEGAQDHDLVCLRNLFTIYSRTNPSIAIDYGISSSALYRSHLIMIALNDHSFYQCLCKAKKMPVLQKYLKSERLETLIRSLISVLRAESLIESAKIIKRANNKRLLIVRATYWCFASAGYCPRFS